jgi:hypothetical protein
MLRIRLTPKTQATSLLVFSFFDLVQAINRETPIRKNKIFHTIGKTQFGGVIMGLTELYQSELISLEVNNPPTAATPYTIIRQIINVKTLLNNFFIYLPRN